MNLQSIKKQSLIRFTPGWRLGPDSASSISRVQKTSAHKGRAKHQTGRPRPPLPFALPRTSSQSHDVQCFILDRCRSSLICIRSRWKARIPQWAPLQLIDLLHIHVARQHSCYFQVWVTRFKAGILFYKKLYLLDPQQMRLKHLAQPKIPIICHSDQPCFMIVEWSLNSYSLLHTSAICSSVMISKRV